jgi:hypothetical protein
MEGFVAIDKKTESVRWPNMAYESALKPPSGMALESALLTSYSAEMPAIVAALRAMGGFAEGDGKLGPRGLAQTLEQVRGRVRITVQRGRLRSNTRARIAGILDQFVYEVGMDEAEGSWHPKMALVHFISKKVAQSENNECWRLWMGSRNLVAAENAELGLCLESAEGSRAHEVPGLTESASWLAMRSGYDEKAVRRLRLQLTKLRWMLPEGCSAVSLKYHLGQAGTGKLPDPPLRIDEVIVVSPFLDVSTVRSLGRWGGTATPKKIVSTEEWLSKIEKSSPSPLVHFHLLAMSKPELEAAEANFGDALEEMDEHSDVAYRRLHAKLLAVRHGKSCTLWMGSANATERGWTGKNVELTAKIEANLQMWQGLENWTNDLREVDRAALRDLIDSETEIQKKLNQERNRLAAAWDAKLVFEPDRTIIMAKSDLHPYDSDLELSVRLLTHSDMKIWPRGQEDMVMAQTRLADRTAFVCVKLSHSGGSAAEWVQCCIIDPPLGDERDGESVGKLLTAFIRKADEGTIGKLIIEAVILLSARSPSDGGKVLRAAAQAYAVDTEAVALKVKQEFAAKEKAREAAKPEPKATTKAKAKRAA